MYHHPRRRLEEPRSRRLFQQSEGQQGKEPLQAGQAAGSGSQARVAEFQHRRHGQQLRLRLLVTTAHRQEVTVDIRNIK